MERRVESTKNHYRISYSLAYGFLIGAFIGFLIVTVLFLVEREAVFFVTDITIESNHSIPDTIIKQAAYEALNTDCTIINSCRSLLLFSNQRLENYIVKQVPLLESVAIHPVGHSITVSVAERELFARFCTDTRYLNCYAVDDGGVLYARMPHVSDLRNIPTITYDPTKLKVNILGRIMPFQLWDIETVTELHAVTELLDHYARIYRIVLNKRDILVEVDKLFDYSLVQDTAILKFNRELLLTGEYNSYLRATLDKLNTFPAFMEKFTVYPLSLEYLDFRFEKRLYMRFQDWELEESVLINNDSS